MPTFSASVNAWVRQSDARLQAVFRDAVQQVANDVRIPKAAGGNMPVDTGNLRRSLTASTVEMPRTTGNEKRTFDQDGITNITMTIAKAKLGETIYLGFQANYAPFQEIKNGFVRLTAQRWPNIVQASATRIRQRVEGT